MEEFVLNYGEKVERECRSVLAMIKEVVYSVNGKEINFNESAKLLSKAKRLTTMESLDNLYYE